VKSITLLLIVAALALGVGLQVVAQEDSATKEVVIVLPPFSAEFFYIPMLTDEGLCEYWGMSLGLTREIGERLPVAKRFNTVLGSCTRPPLSVFVYNANSAR